MPQLLPSVADRKVPDLALEVDCSRSTINKLEIYRGLGVPEVWRWRRGRIHVYVLVDGNYIEAERSALFPDLDLALLVTFIREDHQLAAIEEFRAAVRARRGVTPRTRPRRRSPRTRGSRRGR